MEKPTLNTYSFLSPIDVQQYATYLPNAFDESLTILEKINKLIYNSNQTSLITNELIKKWNEISLWILSDGLTEAVRVKLEKWLQDGTLKELVSDVFDELLALKADVTYVDSTLKRMRYDVKEFGAKGDGITDDTNAIRSAQIAIPESGGNLYFPNGKYLISDSITLKSNVTVVGESPTGALLYPDCDKMNTDDQNNVKPCFRVVKAEKNIGFKNIGVDSSKASVNIMACTLITSGYGISGFFADNVYGKNVYQLLKFSDCENMTFDKIFLDKPTKTLPVPPENAISMTRCRNVNISNSIVYGTAEIVDMSQCVNVVIVSVIGESGIGDENEAFDIGGCRYVSIIGCITNGFGEAVKLKEEGELPDYFTTEDVLIANCQFREFSKAGIDFLTNKVSNDYVIRNIKIVNTNITSSIANSRGLYQISSINNWGFEKVSVSNCRIETSGFAINLSNGSDFEVTNGCKIKSKQFAGFRFVSIADHPYADKTRNVKLNNTEINIEGTGRGVDVAYINGFEMEKVTSTIPNSISGSISNVYLLNVRKPKIKNNRVTGGGYNYSINWLNNENFLNSTLKMADLTFKNNEGINYGLFGVRVNIDLQSDISATYKNFNVSDNDFSNDETVALAGQSAIQFRSKRVTGGFDYIKCTGNTFIRSPIGISYDGTTTGANSMITNNLLYTGV